MEEAEGRIEETDTASSLNKSQASLEARLVERAETTFGYMEYVKIKKGPT